MHLTPGPFYTPSVPGTYQQSVPLPVTSATLDSPAGARGSPPAPRLYYAECKHVMQFNLFSFLKILVDQYIVHEKLYNLYTKPVNGKMVLFDFGELIENLYKKIVLCN